MYIYPMALPHPSLVLFGELLSIWWTQPNGIPLFTDQIWFSGYKNKIWAEQYHTSWLINLLWSILGVVCKRNQLKRTLRTPTPMWNLNMRISLGLSSAHLKKVNIWLPHPYFGSGTRWIPSRELTHWIQGSLYQP